MAGIFLGAIPDWRDGSEDFGKKAKQGEDSTEQKNGAEDLLWVSMDFGQLLLLFSAQEFCRFSHSGCRGAVHSS